MTKNVVSLMVFEDFLMRILFAKKVYMVAKVDFFGLCTAHTFFSPGKLIKKSELVLA